MPDEIVFIIVTGMVMFTTLGLGLMRTISRHLERKHGRTGVSPALRAEVENLRAQMESVDDLRTLVADIEERLDFTERVITRQGESGRLPPSSSDDGTR